MSPIQAMERSYQALKQMLREGRFLPGARLEANRLSADLGVSMTPVRDALHRLVGERLIEASSGEGFHVPQLSEADLRDLYEWNSALLVIAIRTSNGADVHLPPVVEGAPDQAELTELLFSRIAQASPNRELLAALTSAGDRLHPFRVREPDVLAPMIGELEELGRRGSGQLLSVRRYHVRRIKAASALVRARSAGISHIS